MGARLTKPTFSPEEQEVIDTIRALPWAAQFHRTIDNPNAPGGKVDMYLLVDEESGEGLVSVATPHKQGFIAQWIAACCANPWFIRHPDAAEMTGMCVAMNRALAAFVENGEINGFSASIAAMSLFQAYLTELPKPARVELVNRLREQIDRLIEE
jgi:hypothetical protein